MTSSAPTKSPKDLAAELEQKLAKFQKSEASLSSKELADSLHLPFTDLSGTAIDAEALALLDEKTARAAGVAVIYRTGGDLVVAALDPRTPEASAVLEDLRKKFPSIKVLVTSPEGLSTALARYATLRTAETFQAGSVSVDDATLSALGETLQSLSDIQAKLAGASTTELLEIILAGALRSEASDVHLEPDPQGTRIRYRLDGLLHDIATVPTQTAARLVDRLKVVSRLKLNITEAPQDGRFTIKESGTDIEVRVSLLPSEHGESAVLRLLDPRSIRAKLEDLGMRPDVLSMAQKALARPNGAIFTTGPTGSGKTTTLYAFVQHLNTSDTKIITIEDPIEYHIQGISQTQVAPEKGYTFAEGLRAIVRQDPDVILVGEIRDQETAEIALNAALTGHTVLSTLHTNDAAGTVPRLIELGAKPENVAPALTLVLAQRLVRVLCQKCKKESSLNPEQLTHVRDTLAPIAQRFALPEITDTTRVFVPVGCPACNGLGYKGRVAVFELFEITKDMERLISSNPTVSDVRDLAVKNGMVTLLQDGYLKLLDGVTGWDEVVRVLGQS